MKKIALYIILFTHSVVLLKPILPVMADVVAHIFYYKKHIATIHYENGKYHVHKAIEKTIKDDNDTKNTSSKKKENTINEFVLHHQSVSTTAPQYYSVSYNGILIPKLLQGNYKGIDEPPRYNNFIL